MELNIQEINYTKLPYCIIDIHSKDLNCKILGKYCILETTLQSLSKTLLFGLGWTPGQ